MSTPTGDAVDNTAPAVSVVVELSNDDVYTFSNDDDCAIRCGTSVFDAPPKQGTLEDIVDTLRDPDGWIEFGSATMRAPEHDWEPMGEAQYSRSTIFARHVTHFVIVYGEPARMDVPAEWEFDG